MGAADRTVTGVPGFDEITVGGLPAHRMYLVQGSPGTGKTTFGLQFLVEGIRRGESGMYITLSESEAELRQVADGHGLSLNGIHIYDFGAETPLDPNRGYTIFHPSEVELGDITRSFYSEFERINPARLVFDSLSDLRVLADSPFRYRRQILDMKRFFTSKGATILVLDEGNPNGEGTPIESMVHGVISLEHNAPGYGGPRRRLRITKLRGVGFIGGFHDMSILRGGCVIYPRLIAASHLPDIKVKPFPSGDAGLDRLTGGGLDHGTTTLLVGPAGSGKSIVAAHYAMAAAKRTLHPIYFTFDEVRETVLHRAASVGLDLREQVEAGNCVVRQVDPAELSPGEFAGTVREAVEADGSKLVVIDSLNGYYQAMPEENFLNAHMHELLSYLNQQGVLTILILTQQGVLGANMPVPVDVSYLADAIMLLRYFEFAGEIKQTISLVKKRTGYHERLMREFRISSDGIHIGEPLKQFQGILTGVPVYTGRSEQIMP
jgi:circadian clock protein KaiC